MTLCAKVVRKVCLEVVRAGDWKEGGSNYLFPCNMSSAQSGEPHVKSQRRKLEVAVGYMQLSCEAEGGGIPLHCPPAHCAGASSCPIKVLQEDTLKVATLQRDSGL